MGWRKRLHIGILRQGSCLLHELSPDRQGRLGAAQADVAIVVISDPDNAEQIAGVSGEPSVMRAAGFPGGGALKAKRAANIEGGSKVEHSRHHVGHNEGDARIENLPLFRLEVHDYISRGVANRVHMTGEMRVPALAKTV